MQSDIQGAIRGRAGYAFGRLLPFVAGGVAVADLQTPIQHRRLRLPTPGRPLLRRRERPFDDAPGLDPWRRRRLRHQQQLVGARRISLFGLSAKLSDVAPTSLFHRRVIHYAGVRHLTQNQVQVGFNYKFGDAPLDATGFKALAPAEQRSIAACSSARGDARLAGLRAGDLDRCRETESPRLEAGRARRSTGRDSAWTGFYAGGQIGYAWGAQSR